MFGLFGLAGKFSAVIGPIAFGIIIFVLLEPLGTVAYQVAILSLLGLMVLGYWIVRGVPEPPPEAGDAAAAALAGLPRADIRRGRLRDPGRCPPGGVGSGPGEHDGGVSACSRGGGRRH